MIHRDCIQNRDRNRIITTPPPLCMFKVIIPIDVCVPSIIRIILLSLECKFEIKGATNVVIITINRNMCYYHCQQQISLSVEMYNRKY